MASLRYREASTHVELHRVFLTPSILLTQKEKRCAISQDICMTLIQQEQCAWMDLQLESTSPKDTGTESIKLSCSLTEAAGATVRILMKSNRAALIVHLRDMGLRTPRWFLSGQMWTELPTTGFLATQMITSIHTTGIACGLYTVMAQLHRRDPSFKRQKHLFQRLEQHNGPFELHLQSDASWVDW